MPSRHRKLWEKESWPKWRIGWECPNTPGGLRPIAWRGGGYKGGGGRMGGNETTNEAQGKNNKKVSSRTDDLHHNIDGYYPQKSLQLFYSLISSHPPTTMPRITPAAILRSTSAVRQPLTSRAAIRPIFSPAIPSLLATPRRYQSTSQQPDEHSTAETKAPDPKSTGSKPQDAKGGKKGLKVSWIFSGLAGLGALVTIYGLYV